MSDRRACWISADSYNFHHVSSRLFSPRFCRSIHGRSINEGVHVHFRRGDERHGGTLVKLKEHLTFLSSWNCTLFLLISLQSVVVYACHSALCRQVLIERSLV